MTDTPSGWRVLDADHALLVRTYTIGPGNTSNCTVVRLTGDELVVISPSVQPDDATLRDLEAFGRVAAIVAPNGFHRSGTPHWSAAFPDATVHAPTRALPRVRKVAPQARDLDVLAARASDGVVLHALPGMRYGETWLTVQTSVGPVWCVSDTLTNLERLPTGLGWMMRMLGISTGFGLNGAQARFMALDKPAFRRFLRERYAAAAPVQVVPGHGAVVPTEGLADQLGALIEGLGPPVSVR